MFLKIDDNGCWCLTHPSLFLRFAVCIWWVS